MTHVPTLPVTLTRRRWLVLAGTLCSGCGGGGSAQFAGSPGTGGTGSPIFTQGSITGFGSVIINGIKFDDTGAKVNINGMPVVNSADLRLGMIADVQGARGVDLTVGTASRIDVWSIAQGVVTRVGSTEFDVAGMTVQVDKTCALNGISSLTMLPQGASVAVWGLQSSIDGRQWSATRVEILGSPATLVSTGLLKLEDGQRWLNGYLLTGAAVQTLADDAWVRVEGVMAGQANLAVTHATVLKAALIATAPGDIEIEGVVTSIVSPTRFLIGNTTVDASNVALLSVVSSLVPGTRLEVYGRWSEGILMASQIKFEGSQSSVEISAVIDQFTSVSNFVMRGQRCDASLAVFVGGLAANLKAGITVKVDGEMDGDRLRLSSVSFNHSD